MTVRKPAGESWESFVDRQIREAQDRGDFDALPLAGRPIPDLHQPYDELWWVRRKLKDEQLANVPPALALRREVDEARELIARVPTEAAVREIVAAINLRIRETNRLSVRGPATTLGPMDEERVVREWAAQRVS